MGWDFLSVQEPMHRTVPIQWILTKLRLERRLCRKRWLTPQKFKQCWSCMYVGHLRLCTGRSNNSNLLRISIVFICACTVDCRYPSVRPSTACTLPEQNELITKQARPENWRTSSFAARRRAFTQRPHPTWEAGVRSPRKVTLLH